MPFIPHTDEDIKRMLDVIGVNTIDDLFDEIPPALRISGLANIPDGLNEMAASQLFASRAREDGHVLNFIGAGAYEHYIPAAVWQLVSRGEFMTAYTPYQAEASQGTLQVIYEYQTMITRLLGMQVANASLYDGATAAAEACLMAVRLKRQIKTPRVLVPRSLHPHYRAVLNSLLGLQDIEIVEIDFDPKTGVTDVSKLDSYRQTDVAALVIPQPNFFGRLEPVHAMSDWAHANHIISVAVVNPTAMAWLKPPGQWGQFGADIACGEGQPLGVPLASGGPYFGFMATREAFVRQMPGRIVGQTLDLSGRPGFTLTLQAREQHIRRAKATSNICTNQGLLVTAATIYMALLGPQGLQRVAEVSHRKLVEAQNVLTPHKKLKLRFPTPSFHECVWQLQGQVGETLAALSAQGIQAGLALGQYYPELEDCFLMCVTETKTESDLLQLKSQLHKVLA